MRFIHQIDTAMVLYESAELMIAIIVVVVLVRWIVLAVIGSHLTFYLTLNDLHLIKANQTYASIPKVTRTISNPTPSTARALSNNMTVGTIPAVTNFCASLSDCDERN
jgi:hypothetical protein